MNFLHSIITNKAIIIPAFSWFAAQLIKVVYVTYRDRKVDFTRFVGSGGMPSSHTSFIVSLATITGRSLGWGSVEFGITFAVALIVMYDAAGIRRAAGIQAKVLNELIFSSDHKIPSNEKLKELLGHSPLEVFMGALLGIALGLWLC